MAGIVVGAMFGADGAFGASLSGLWAAINDAFSSKWNWWILLFTFALIALVSIAEVSGGIAGIINKLTARVKSRRGAETATVALGGMLFFDDYANTMVVGSTMKPLTDQYGTSRAKLAYLVDSTAAPLAGIALLSTGSAMRSVFSKTYPKSSISASMVMLYFVGCSLSSLLSNRLTLGLCFRLQRS